MPRPVHTSCEGPRWRRSAGLRPTCTGRSQKLIMPQHREQLRRGPFSRQVMRQPSGILPRTSNDGFCQRCCHMARPQVVLVLIAAQRSSPRTAQPDIQGDVRRDSGGAASHWSIPEPHGPAEARRDHQSSCGGAAERRQDIVQSQRKPCKRVCVPRLAHKMPDFEPS